MTPLRGKYIRDLVIRGRLKHTQEAYTRYVRDLARYVQRQTVSGKKLYQGESFAPVSENIR